MALLMVLISATAGIIVALKFNWPGFLGESAALTWGRLRYVHTQGIFFGWLGNAFIAFLYYAVPRLLDVPRTRQNANELGFLPHRTIGWLLLIAWNFGMVLPGFALMMAGYSQSLEWAEFPIGIDVVVLLCFAMLFWQFIVPFLRARLSDMYVSGWYIIGAITFTALAYPVGNFAPEWVPGARGATYSGLWIHDSIGFFALSFLVLAVWPNQELAATIAATKPASVVALTDSELRGRAIYAREGCAYCHTQLVRSTQYDVRRFGPVSRAWESEDEYPQLWGTRRIGPDLAREGNKRPSDWQRVHLFNPRHVVPMSMMPGYPWLFDGVASKPTQEGIDIVAYVQSLGRNGDLAGLGLRQPKTDATAASSRAASSLAEIQAAGNAHTGGFDESLISWDKGPPPLLLDLRGEVVPESLANQGHVIFKANCSGCHVDCGCGDGPAAEGLLPKPRELTTVRLSPTRLSEVLWNGVPGSSMPAWSELSLADLRALAAFTTALSEPLYQPEAELEPRELATAEQLFQHNCALCHGVQGRGDGVQAAALAPQPTNFRDTISIPAYVENAIANGVPGTAMPRWDGNLSGDEQRLLARYVRSLFEGSIRP